MSYSDSLEASVLTIVSSKTFSYFDIDNRKDKNYLIEENLYQLYIKLHESNHNIFVIVNTLNRLLQQHPKYGPMIITCHDLECFIKEVDDYKSRYI